MPADHTLVAGPAARATMMNRYLPMRGYVALLELLGMLAGAAVAALAVLGSFDVVIRNLGWGNLPWLLELAEYVIYATTFLAAPWVLHQGAHVRVDLLISSLPAAGARVLELLVDALGLAISAVLFWYALATLRESYALGGLVVKELVVPEWWLLSIIPCSTALLMVEFSARLVRTFATPAAREAP